MIDRRAIRAVAPLALALMLAGCVAAPQPSGPLAGSWGGRGVALTLQEDGGRLEYDCAAGTIDGPLLPDAAGRFAAQGTHTPGLGGPARSGDPPPSYPARYSGTVRGGEMRLEVEVPARGFSLGSFTLRRGEQAMLLRCL